MCTVKVPLSFGDNRSFKSNTLCSLDGPFRTLIETWLGSGVLIIDHNLSLIRNLTQTEYCLCKIFTKTLLTNKDINTPVLFFWWALNVVYMMFNWFNYLVGQVLWIPLIIIGIRNPSSTDKESRMQYPWCRIENPRLSDFLAWADHCFQLDKIKDIMCFHYFIFATRKKSHKLQYINMQVFYFWQEEIVDFHNVSVFKVAP